MIIESLAIHEGMYRKSYSFAKGFTLISSNGRNSVGKTTLIRLIIYALGEEVSMTQGFDPKNLVTELVLITDDGKHLELVRDATTLTIVADGESERFNPPHDLREIKKRIYGIDNPELADNLLGAHYIDQDKGWTLLNRGKVIGGIQFSIEAFLRGLTNRNYDKQLKRIRELDAEIEKYTFIVEAAGYQNTMVDIPDVAEISPDKSRDRERLSQLRIQAASLKKRIATIRKAQNGNERFVNYIVDMGLRVKMDDGSELAITPDNLLYYSDTERYLNGEALALRTELAEIGKHIEELEARLDEGEDKLFSVERVDTREFDRQIAGMKLDLPMCQDILDSLKKERTSIRQEMGSGCVQGNPLFDSITERVDEYCAYLGIEEYFRNDSRGILTNTLKRKSGTNYHQLVFAFRLAYADAVNRVCGVKLPLIIDSIRGREMSRENFEKCIGLLIEKFSDYQIIIASISGEGIPADSLIKLERRVMENAEINTNVPA